MVIIKSVFIATIIAVNKYHIIVIGIFSLALIHC